MNNKLLFNQDEIYSEYLDGKNIFITGPGGSGKTYMIKKIYDHAIKSGQRISVTALTGVAALLLDCSATTIHSWAGIGIAKNYDSVIKKVVKSKFRSHNWYNTDILIVDEISMMSMKMFNLLNDIGQKIHNNKKPFGGIQIIFSGDFFQLPPIKDPEFCFESENFMSSFDSIVALKKVYRQTDATYKKILLNMRKGILTKKGLELLNSRLIKNLGNSENECNGNITRLVPTKKKANDINNKFLNNLETKSYKYNREYAENRETITKNDKIRLDTMESDEKESEFKFIRESTLTEDVLELKVGAFVMCIVNLDPISGIVNGSQGIIENFDNNGMPIVKFDKCTRTICKHSWKSENIPGLSIDQLPLILAWGITIHKSQGITLKSAIIDAGNDIFEAGQIYVALSRLTTLNGLYLDSFNPQRLKINSTVLNFYVSNNLLN